MIAPLLALFPAVVLAAEADPKIVNGTEEEGFPSVVSLGADFGGQRYSFCTGNLITPRIVLSAAHCSADLPLEAVVAIGRAFVGPNVDDAEHILAFSDASVHPDYVPLSNGPGGTLGENDAAVLILAEDAPIAATPIHLDPVDDEDLGIALTSVGFGITETGRGDGVKRSAVLSLDEYDEVFLYSYNRNNETNSNICSGDSGGPQFAWVDDHWEQWAIHSWGDQNCEQVSGSTRVDSVSEWLLDQVEAVHGTRDLCEANGYYADGICTPLCATTDPECVEEEEDSGDPTVDGGGAKESPGGCQSVPLRGSWLGVGAFVLALSSRIRAKQRN